MGLLRSVARKLGTGAARFAKKRITGALDSASEALERVVFGEKPEEEEAPDPFAKLKEKERKESGKVR